MAQLPLPGGAGSWAGGRWGLHLQCVYYKRKGKGGAVRTGTSERNTEPISTVTGRVSARVKGVKMPLLKVSVQGGMDSLGLRKGLPSMGLLGQVK